MGHIHAELMMQYAEDARETDRPWERWEFRYNENDTWIPFSIGVIGWQSDCEYRRKPRTITINGREVPEPMREVPEIGTRYFIPTLRYEGLNIEYCWDDHSFDARVMDKGLCHSTKEAAIAHAEALLSFTEAK